MGDGVGWTSSGFSYSTHASSFVSATWWSPNRSLVTVQHFLFAKHESIKGKSRRDEQQPRESRSDLISLTERQLECGCQATTRDRGTLEVILNFQRNPIKTAAAKRQTLARRLLCNTASVRGLSMTPGEIGPSWGGSYEKSAFAFVQCGVCADTKTLCLSARLVSMRSHCLFSLEVTERER